MSGSDDDDIERELLRISDDEPSEALDLIAALTERDPSPHPLLLFCKFNAMRHLATDRLYSKGRTGVHGIDIHEFESLFGPEEVGWAREALGVIAELEEVDPRYLIKHDFVNGLIDQVCAPLEKSRPGIVQLLLGWTKLSYFGLDRVRFLGDLLQRIPEDFIRHILRARLSIPAQVTAAIVCEYTRGPGRHEADLMLLRRDPEDGEVVGDVEEGILLIRENGEYEYTPKGSTSSFEHEGLNHPNRERLLQEAEMLLKYENDASRRMYLYQMIEWLNGRGERPVLG